jgi:hypothetical protein
MLMISGALHSTVGMGMVVLVTAVTAFVTLL